MANLEKLKAEVTRLKEQVKAMREKQSLISESQRLKISALETKRKLGRQKKKLKRELHPGRAKFSDFVKAQFKKNRKIAFKKAVQLAKKAYDGEV
jgi:hypothetical protein